MDLYEVCKKGFRLYSWELTERNNLFSDLGLLSSLTEGEGLSEEMTNLSTFVYVLYISKVSITLEADNRKREFWHQDSDHESYE